MSFQHVAWRPLPYSMGVEIGMDWQDKAEDDPRFPRSGFWTEAESALLRDIARRFRNNWIEVGAHTGWCTHQISNQGNWVTAIEPMFSDRSWYQRFAVNTGGDKVQAGWIMPWAGRSDQYFAIWDGGGGRTFDGALIDGDHNAPHPLSDAVNCYHRLNERGVILLHDFRGPDVWDAGKFLVDQGMQWKIYPSVHMIFCAWRGEFEPPEIAKEGETDWVKHYGLPGWAK